MVSYMPLPANFSVGPPSLVANAGPNVQLQLPVNHVTIYGNGTSESGGEIVSYQWTRGQQNLHLSCDMEVRLGLTKTVAHSCLTVKFH